MQVMAIASEEEKVVIARKILEALPNWFGIPESIDGYVDESKGMPFYAVFEHSVPIGFVAIKQHNAFSAELYVMGIDEAYHRQSIGKKLIACSERFCKEQGISFLQVKTLDESRENQYYAKTRAFCY